MIDCTKHTTNKLQNYSTQAHTSMILQQMHMHYTKDYTLRLSKRSHTDEESKGVASGTPDSETPDGQGGGVGEAGGD